MVGKSLGMAMCLGLGGLLVAGGQARGQECPCSADFNGDEIVNLSDFMIYAECVGRPVVNECANVDINCDGEIDGYFDYHAFECQFPGPPGPPECCDTTCCMADHSCEELSEEDCLLAGGEVTAGPCDFGGCCLDEETCEIMAEATCLAMGGTFYGPCLKCTEQVVVVVIEPGGEIFEHVIGPATTCPSWDGKKVRARDCEEGTFLDTWVSDKDDVRQVKFGSGGYAPIPADFFGPGSDPFEGSIPLKGAPLGLTEWGEFGQADTLVMRTEDPFDRCDLPSPAEVTVDVDVVALSLTSVSPITVTYNGGQNPEDWDSDVDLSTVTPPPGTLTAEKTHCNGGTYTSVLHVQTRFTFTKVSDPEETRVLDTGEAGLDYVTLVQDVEEDWVTDVDEDMGAAVDPCTDFHGGLEQHNPHGSVMTECDCQLNGVHDLCDIEQGTSLDCNDNDYPDECEPGLGCMCPCGDLNNDGGIDLNDFVIFSKCFNKPPSFSSQCTCCDMDGVGGLIDLNDFVLFSHQINKAPGTVTPPDCP